MQASEWKSVDLRPSTLHRTALRRYSCLAPTPLGVHVLWETSQETSEETSREAGEEAVEEAGTANCAGTVCRIVLSTVEV